MDLNIEYGKIEIAPEVIQLISGLAATSVKGVLGLSGGSVVNDLNELLGRKNLRKGIRVELEEPLLIEIPIILHFGYNLPDVGRQVQEKVKAAVESMTGLEVGQVKVKIDGVKFQPTEKKIETKE